MLLFIATACQSSHHKELNQELRTMAQNLNKSTSTMFDEYTRFDGADVTSDNVFRYHYTILNTENPEALLEQKASTMKDQMVAVFAVSPELKIFTDNKVTIQYLYSNSDGQLLKTITITPEDYKVSSPFN